MIPLLAASAANSLAAAVWQGVLLAAIVALCLRLLPWISAAARSLIWTAAFTLTFLLHFAPHTSKPNPETSVLQVTPTWTLALAALWLLLSSIRATQLVLSALALRRLSRNATSISAYQTPRHYTLCTSSEVDRPSVIGFFRPRILLPSSLYATLTPAELHQVLLHETEHLRRRDDWTNLLQKLALVLFPLNPALFWIERRLCLEREFACDDRVLRVTGAPKCYATCLAALAQHTLLRRGVSLALGILGVVRPGRQSELSRRVHRILRTSQQSLSPRTTTAVTAALLLTFSAGALKLTHAPHFISFVPAQIAPVAQAAQADLAPINDHRSIDPQASFIKTSMRITPAARPSQTKLRRPHQSRVSIGKPLSTANFRAVNEDGPIRLENPHFILTDISTSQASFTYVPAVAIATPDGWLIIQL